MTDDKFFYEKAKEAGLDITSEEDKEIIRCLEHTVCIALHGDAKFDDGDEWTERIYRYHVDKGAIIFDSDLFYPEKALRVAYLLNVFGFKLHNDVSTNCYKIFIRK